jgi:sporulation protein YlmC with PRC-barrel domain
MKLSAKAVRGSEVLLMDRKSPAALIRGLIFDAETGKLLGFKVGLDKIICFLDLNFDEHKKIFYIKSPDCICPTNEVVRIDQCLSSGGYFNKQQVVTETGRKLGKLYDLNFEPVSGVVTDITAKKGFLLWSKDSVIAKHNILDVTAHKIKVKCDGAKVPIFEAQIKNKTAPVGGAALSDLLTN